MIHGFYVLLQSIYKTQINQVYNVILEILIMNECLLWSEIFIVRYMYS